MKQYQLFIKLLLIVTTMGYTSAWAFDSHAIEIDNHDAIVSIIDEHNPDVSLSDTDICDHCCHATAHMVGLIMRDGFQCLNNNACEKIKLTQHSKSFIPSPDRKPPKA